MGRAVHAQNWMLSLPSSADGLAPFVLIQQTAAVHQFSSRQRRIGALGCDSRTLREIYEDDDEWFAQSQVSDGSGGRWPRCVYRPRACDGSGDGQSSGGGGGMLVEQSGSGEG